MSNLFKYGQPGFSPLNNAPFIIDANKKLVSNEPKVIRPVEEQQDENIEEAATQNEELFDNAMDMAREIREEAVATGKEIVARAEAEADEIRENAYKEGYEKGLEEGGMEAARRSDEYLERLQREQDEFLRKSDEIMAQKLEESKNGLVDICCRLIKKLTGILVSDYEPVLLHMINNAVVEDDNAREFIIKVPEQNYLYIFDNKDRISGASNPNISIEIFADSNLLEGQCIIETENGIIDLSMDLQVSNLITAIKLLSE